MTDDQRTRSFFNVRLIELSDLPRCQRSFSAKRMTTGTTNPVGGEFETVSVGINFSSPDMIIPTVTDYAGVNSGFGSEAAITYSQE